MNPLLQYIGCTLVLSTALWAQDSAELRPLSLREALHTAQSKNPQTQAANQAVEQARADQVSARGRLLPEANITARVTRINDPIILDLDPIRSAMIGLHATQPDGSVNPQVAQLLDTRLPHFQSEVQSELYYNATASVVWPIFTGGRLWANYQAAKANVKSLQAEEQSVQSAVLLETCQRYFSLRLAHDLVALRRQTLQTLTQHLENARRLEAAGQITVAERLRAEVAWAEAERELSDALRDQSLARLALANTLGSDTLISPTTPMGHLTSNVSLTEWQQKAQNNHPLLQRLHVESTRTQYNLNAARGEWLPVVSLFGKRELYTQDLTLFEPTWAVGAQLQWNLFSGGQTLGKQQAAKSLQRQVQWRTTQASENIQLLVEKRWRELEHAHARLLSLDKTTELAQESLRAQQKAFDAGLATSLDVVDAQLALARVGMAQLKAQFDKQMALAGLLETSGNITALANWEEESP